MKLGLGHTVGVIAAAVFIANWVSAEYLSYPFAWCFGKWALQPVIEPAALAAHLWAWGYFVFAVLRRDAFKALKGLMVVGFVFGFPTFMEILFRLGKSCTR
jgi:hypothetical protein